mmetsp:Transcript_11648/g.17686  ORF Transcript_11648/g.17686 Transcript_11648/m.17686 type:complete len:91 (+) Transcript_11648:1477-1749(+)
MITELEEEVGEHLIISKIKRVEERLRAGLKVQDSSAKMMSFLVQDFLDYAQIKSGKFRVNTKPFDITETIEKVMCIQRLKAAESSIKLEA